MKIVVLALFLSGCYGMQRNETLASLGQSMQATDWRVQHAPVSTTNYVATPPAQYKPIEWKPVESSLHHVDCNTLGSYTSCGGY